MIAILYPLKMDKLSEAYSAIYEELSPGLQRSEANVKKNIATQAAANKKVESDRAKTASEFQAHKKEVMSKGGRPVDALDSWQKKKIEARKEVKDSYEPLGKYRSQWESLKLQEHNDYREEFDSWIGGLAEEGYDIDRWDDIELVETFINELNLWGSQDAVVEALMNSEVEIDEEDKVWTGFKELIEKKEEKEKKITGEGVNNAKLIKVFPDEVKEEMETKEKPDPQLASKQKKANMAKKQVLMKKMQAVRMGAGDQIMASKKVEGNVIKEMEHEMKPEIDIKPKSKKEKKEEDDPRSMPTKINLAKNKMRAMGLNMGYKHDQGLVDAYQKVYQNGEQQIDEILEKGARGKIDFNTGKQTTDTGKKTKEGYPISQEKQVMKTKRVTVNNPKGRKRNQSPAGKTIGKLQQVKQKQYDAERKGDRKAANKAFERRKKLSGTLYDKTGSFHDRADND